MSQAKLDAAAELIRERRYHEARIILRTVDHPIAMEWLLKLDQIAPEYMPYYPPPVNENKLSTGQTVSKFVWLLIQIGIILPFALCGIFMIISLLSPSK